MRKKYIQAIVLSILYMSSLCACGNSSTSPASTSSALASSVSSASESFSNEFLKKALGNTISSNNNTEEVSSAREEDDLNSKSNWTLKYYVDEFGDATSQKYINYVDIGTFSNTATTNSTLVYSIMIDNSDFAIKLIEYGRYPVLNSYSRAKEYDIATKLDNGTKRTYSGVMYAESGDRIFFQNSKSALISSKSSLLTDLQSSKSITFLITDKDNPTTTYKFTVDTTGFAQAYEQL